MQDNKPLSEKESLELITQMINKAKDSYYDTGISSLMWGAVIAICSLVRVAEIQFGFTMPFDIYFLALVAILPQVFINMKEKKERKVKSYDDAYMHYIWLAFGICIFLLIFFCNVVFNAWPSTGVEYKHYDHPFYEYTAAFFLMLYGLPTFITGAACKFTPMLWGGILCWVCAILSVFTEIRIDLLLTALSALVAWFIPGILMAKAYKEAKKAEAKLNV